MKCFYRQSNICRERGDGIGGRPSEGGMWGGGGGGGGGGGVLSEINVTCDKFVEL